MYDYEKYGIKVGQIYRAADGSKICLVVINVDTHRDSNDVIVKQIGTNIISRIDCFKLTQVRYYLTNGKLE